MASAPIIAGSSSCGHKSLDCFSQVQQLGADELLTTTQVHIAVQYIVSKEQQKPEILTEAHPAENPPQHRPQSLCIEGSLH